ncbi:DNA methyltransferase [Streptomyces sp. NRRL S-1022]|uniref:DNA methyltransferase n=1 Tax=Streptomyces sp. NRRL S-1022 TaxID=1463880 RepID=UPI00131C1E3A|nr:site-specific DNA-methyltransferase [Streptomyces sp. NRRL S-1022]
MTAKSKLFYGDNLDVLRSGQIPAESVDLVYLDPPFNSNKVYNVVFDGMGDAQAQIQAFDDTWKWTNETDDTYNYLVNEGGLPPAVADMLESLRNIVRETNLMAYLINMTPRLVELHKVLKKSGSLYIHCDPTASHYLKVVLDAIFGARNFRNEIIWRRTGAHAPRSSFGPLHDTILFYTKSDSYYFNVIRRPYTKQHVEKRYKLQGDGRWKFTSGGNVLTGAGIRTGESGMPWRGFNPTLKNRHWALPKFVADQMPEGFKDLGLIEKMEAAYQAGLIEITPGAAWPTPVRYFQPEDGNPLGDIWAYQPGTAGCLAGTDAAIDEDVAYLGPTDPERLGYPTQKPVGLLERIIRSSCPEGGTVLDPFCGCGTTLDAAVKLGYNWIGIDITYLAVDLIRNRLRNTHGDSIDATYEVLGVPADLAGAHALFAQSPFDFERWAVSLVRGTPNQKQVADKGSDGVVVFATGKKSRAKAVVSVKGGKGLNPSMVRDLEGVVAKTKNAEVGILLTLHKSTKGMRDAAATAGSYTDWVGNKYPKVQIISVEELLSGVRPKLPPIVPPYTEAKKRVDTSGQQSLFDSPEQISEKEDVSEDQAVSVLAADDGVEE